MHSVELVFAIGWAAFWIYWLVAAFPMKKGRILWSRDLRIRAAMAVLAILLAWFGSIPKQRDQLGSVACWPRTLPSLSDWVRDLGWSPHRPQLGAPMSQKDEPELVTSGPYRLVRHPIYSGILLAVLGTADLR